MIKKTAIVCFGEVLWDMLPTGKVAGGAPMNVAFHAQNFGMDAQLISAIGNDELGKELLQFLQQKGIPTDLIHTNYTFDTSTVQVTLDKKGAASYEIVEPVAWDFLYTDDARESVVENADFLLFGSLITRSDHNFRQLLQLIAKAKKVVFDVNLRPPFYTQSIIETLLQKAHIVKMNDEELDIITGWYGLKNNVAGQMRLVKDQFNIETLVMTKGKHGAFCLHDNVLVVQKSFPVKVKDTVGSGDSFLAAFIYKMSKGLDWQKCLEFACATGSLLATKNGGTHKVDEHRIQAFLQKNS